MRIVGGRGRSEEKKVREKENMRGWRRKDVGVVGGEGDEEIGMILKEKLGRDCVKSWEVLEEIIKLLNEMVEEIEGLIEIKWRKEIVIELIESEVEGRGKEIKMIKEIEDIKNGERVVVEEMLRMKEGWKKRMRIRKLKRIERRIVELGIDWIES